MAIEVDIMDMNKVEWTNIREKIRQVCYQGGQSMTVTLGEVTPGHTVGPHSHKYEQMVFILQGECDFYVDGVPRRLGPGCLMSIPPMVEHYICAVGEVPMLNMDIFTPKRWQMSRSDWPSSSTMNLSSPFWLWFFLAWR